MQDDLNELCGQIEWLYDLLGAIQADKITDAVDAINGLRAGVYRTP